MPDTIPTITLTFENIEINTSVQVGDTAYYVTTEDSPTWSMDLSSSNIIELGVVTKIDINSEGNRYIEVQAISEAVPLPPVNNFIFFSKDNSVNMASPLGYYSNIQFRNDSKVKGEIFSVGCEIFESSK